MSSRTKLLVILLVAVVVLVAAYFGFARKYKNATPAKQQGTNINSQLAASTSSVITQQVDKSKVPEYFPQNLPWENGTEILQNFNTKNGQTTQNQAARAYVTEKSLAENFSLYKKYLSDNGWNILNATDQENIKVVSGVKGSDRLDVIISHSSADNRNVVTVMFATTAK